MDTVTTARGNAPCTYAGMTKMDGTPKFNPRSDAAPQRSDPGKGDDVACEKCGEVALDTGLECGECGHDNWEAVTGEPSPFGVGRGIKESEAENSYE